jgi:hypothetical protein
LRRAFKFTENSRKFASKAAFGRSSHLTLFPALVYDINKYMCELTGMARRPKRGRLPPQ